MLRNKKDTTDDIKTKQKDPQTDRCDGETLSRPPVQFLTSGDLTGEEERPSLGHWRRPVRHRPPPVVKDDGLSRRY